MPFDKVIQSISSLREEISGEFDVLLKEMSARFGTKPDPNEIFRPLPEPQGLSISLMQALEARRSERSFSNEPLSDQDLSNILFAADGINRKNGRRTTPSALDWQDTEIYVLKANGIWRWVPERRGLIFCAREDIRARTCYAQPTVARAPVQLVYVSNRAKTRSTFTDLAEKVFTKISRDVWTEEKINEMRVRATHINAGAKIEAVYLAAAAMDMACVSRTGFPTDELERLLHLTEDETIVACQSLGYRPKSILDHIR